MFDLFRMDLSDNSAHFIRKVMTEDEAIKRTNGFNRLIKNVSEVVAKDWVYIYKVSDKV